MIPIKHFFLGLCLICLSTGQAAAQSYARLWKDAQAAMNDDKPKTALQTVERIVAKATAERQEAQLLKGVLVQLQLHQDIAPDSAKKMLRQLEETAGRPDGMTPEAAALWRSATGQLCMKQWGDTAAVSRGKDLLRASVADFERLHQAKATDYLPLFVAGKDSRYFQNDLLSVLAKPLLQNAAFTQEERRAMAAKLFCFYNTKHLREAALLSALDTVRLAPYRLPMTETLRKMAADYRDVPLNVETYIELVAHANREGNAGNATDSMVVALAREGLALYGKMPRAERLRHWVKEKENTEAALSLQRQRFLPGKDYALTVRVRNAKDVTLRLVRLNAKADDKRLTSGNEKALRGIAGRVVKTYDKAFAAKPAWAFVEDSMLVRFPETGVYRLELLVEGKAVASETAYVSRLFAMRLTSEGDTCRLRAVDAVSGQPLKAAKLRILRRQNGEYVQQRTLTADTEGEIAVRREATRSNLRYFLSTPDDAFLPSLSLGFSMWEEDNAVKEQTNVNLFTDRAIYRPGQEVAFSGIVYTQRGDEVQAHPRFSSDFLLRDSNGQELARLTCHTDSFGVVSGRFRLPSVCLPGIFSLQGTSGGYTNFRVEEYKRPTFTVSTSLPQEAFRLGDSITIKGKAETFTGLPVKNARVKYTIGRQGSYFYYRSGQAGETMERETVTDSLGAFCIPLTLRLNEDRYDGARPLRFALFSIQADVTAENGETASTSRFVSASTKSSWLSTDFPKTVCREVQVRFTVAHTGNNGQALGGEADFRVTQGQRTVAAGRLKMGSQALPKEIAALPSGEYLMSITMTGVDTLRQAFVIFSEHDERPFGHQTFWNYVRTSERGDSALVVVGSPCDSVTLFCDIFAGNRRVDHRMLTFSNRLLRFPLCYKAEWGDGATAIFAFVRNDTLHRVSTSLIRPRPEKRLNLRWRSFRSTLQPGQGETWSLQVTNADGTPATASLMARLYDASLDAFATSKWTLPLYFERHVPTARYSDMPAYALWLTYQKSWKARTVPTMAFTVWNEQLLSSSYGITTDYAVRKFGSIRLQGKGQVLMASAATRSNGSMKREYEISVGADSADRADEAAQPESATEVAEAGATAGGGQARVNFAETAFFLPALQTDENGMATLSFTLPQRLTSWNFTALAHTKGMDNGRLDTTVVARKELMVEPALPRFVRQGDRLTVPVTLRNLTEKTLRGTLFCHTADPDGRQGAKTQKRKFTLRAGEEQVQRFDIETADNASLLLCRITGETLDFSDGEEHLLPVLANSVERSVSVPFAMTKAGRTEVRTDTLWSRQADNRRLTVEMTSNPTWSAVSVLAPLATANEESATGWATRYYALLLAEQLTKENPVIARALADSAAVWTSPLSRNSDLKQVLMAESPWAAEAKTERERAAALALLFDAPAMAVYKATAVDHLQALQDAQGGWCWYPGMRANVYLTADVALLLARLQTMAPKKVTAMMLDKAVAFLQREIKEEVARAKREKHTIYIGTAHLNYLYIRALLNQPADETTRLLTKLALKQAPTATMDFKALLAVVLQKTGNKKEAKTLRESLKEHTVSTPAFGRYFDTQRTRFSSQWYRIPAQVATIEALRVSGNAADEKVADEMRLWLMQSKRTQMWQAGRTSADAVYALLAADNDRQPVMSLNTSTRPMTYSLYQGRQLVGFSAPSKAKGLATWGYVCDTYAEAKPLLADRLIVNKETEGLSWGTVTAQFTEPLAATTASGTDLSISRHIQRWENGQWATLPAKATLRVGERVRQVVTLKAVRDMDFVAVKLSHPANFEVRNTLSCYVWNAPRGSYRAVRDASIARYFDHLPKGTLTFTEEYNVNRAGSYECGIATAQCQYAPEFSANTASKVVRAE